MPNTDGHDGAIDIKDPALFPATSSIANNESLLLSSGKRISLSAFVALLTGSPYGLSDDQTGAEVESLLDAHFGGTGWRQQGAVTDGDKGDVTVSGNGNTWSLNATGVVAGSYTNVNLTVNAKGQITAISSGGSAGAGSRNYTDLTAGGVTATVGYFGATAPTLSEVSTGTYEVVCPANVDVVSIDLHGSSATLSGSGEFVIRINNSANTKNLKFISQVHITGNGGLANDHSLGINHSRSFNSNTTIYSYPSMQPFAASGFDINLIR